MEKLKHCNEVLFFLGLFAFTGGAPYQSFVMTLFGGNPNLFTMITSPSSTELLLAIKAGQSLRCAGMCLATSRCTAFYYDASSVQNFDCQLLKLLSKPNLTTGVDNSENQFFAAVTADVLQMKDVAPGGNVTVSSIYNFTSSSICVTMSLGCLPRYLNDGLMNTIWHSATADSQPWVSINLIYDHLVYSVNVSGRCDGYYKETRDFDVRVGVDAAANAFGYVQGDLCQHWTGAYNTSCQKQTLVCATLLRGSVVSVQTTIVNAGFLSIGEISILGYPLQTI